jgi:Tfp pilus assembly protein PilE
MKKLTSNKGVTLLVLAITIALMLILSVSISINIKPFMEIKKATNIETDIAKLEEKISIYYSKNKSFPTANKYTNIQGITKNPNDNENYYVIDLSKLDNLNLNYGKDFEKIEDKTTEISDLLDIYIINEQSGNIYYLDN